MDEKEMEIFTDIMRKCGVNTEKHTWSELEDMAKAMEEYYQTKLKLSRLQSVAGTVELREACQTVVKGYEEDGMEQMETRDEVFYSVCKNALTFTDLEL